VASIAKIRIVTIAVIPTTSRQSAARQGKYEMKTLAGNQLKLLFAVTVLFGSVAVAGSAQASTYPGGGCNHANANGVDADICISYSNGNVLPDFYLNSYQHGCSRVAITWWARAAGSGDGGWVQMVAPGGLILACKKGHNGPYPYDFLPLIVGQHGQEYMAALQIWDGAGNPVWWLESPIQYVS
jgi:hypothetical protein